MTDLIVKVFPELAGQPFHIVLISLALLCGYQLLYAVASWRVYEKMGEKGWYSLIPLFNYYILYKRCYSVKAFWKFVVISLIALICDYGSMRFSLQENIELLVNIIYIICSIWLLYEQIIMLIRLSKAFDHGVLFGWGLYLFQIVFMLILAFGKSEYLENPEESKKWTVKL